MALALYKTGYEEHYDLATGKKTYSLSVVCGENSSGTASPIDGTFKMTPLVFQQTEVMTTNMIGVDSYGRLTWDSTLPSSVNLVGVDEQGVSRSFRISSTAPHSTNVGAKLNT